MAHNFYAVKRGFDKKQNKEITDLIAEDWYEVAPLIKGYNDARYKGFDTKEEAETWLSVVDKTDAEKESRVSQHIKEDMDKETLLYQMLKKHVGHRVEIAEYGDGINFALEDMDTNEVIFDTDIYNLTGREKS